MEFTYKQFPVKISQTPEKLSVSKFESSPNKLKTREYGLQHKEKSALKKLKSRTDYLFNGPKIWQKRSLIIMLKV